MKRKTIIGAAVAVALMVPAGAMPAWAYFTDHSTTNGGLVIHATPDTGMKEWYGEKKKKIMVTNSADATTSVFARAKFIYPSSFDVEVTKSTGWFDGGDGWWYYGASATALTALAPGESVSEEYALEGTITFPTVKSETEPEGVPDGAQYSVVALYECTPVAYNADGTTTADWDQKRDSTKQNRGN